ncbi:MAG TPA: hypothetical protein VF221_19190 [Chloroflexota bacterium]
MRRVSAIVLTVAIAGATASMSSAGIASAHQAGAPSHQDFPPRPGATPIVIGLPNLNPPTATPGPAHSSPSPSKPSTPSKPAKSPPDAVRMALGNGYVKALLHGKAYRVKKVGPWPAGQGKTVQFAFYHPATIAGTWLAAGKGPYRATYRNVKSIKVFVNVRRAQVMATIPYPRIRV